MFSPLFTAAGVRDILFEFYPNGSAVTQQEGMCGFYIRCPDGTSVTCRPRDFQELPECRSTCSVICSTLCTFLEGFAAVEHVPLLAVSDVVHRAAAGLRGGGGGVRWQWQCPACLSRSPASDAVPSRSPRPTPCRRALPLYFWALAPSSRMLAWWAPPGLLCSK